ncbi:MAG: glycine dehydrogenase (aminomethyl-transferring) [Crocinitomicaceae bacterium]|nr:glycine dehydrogenase (aminomethyl-transferring) [Crocinitomicaceae bacterium]
MSHKSFSKRHIGVSNEDQQKMLSTVKSNSISDLIDQTIPSKIRSCKDLSVGESMNERDYLSHIQKIAKKNKLFDSFIGQGYYGTETPSVILRNVLENPGWYTAYTPYQAEISQGRLEALLNFQTMISDLTGMELSNASLLDEGTAAAEAMLMFFHMRSRKQEKQGVNKFFVANSIFTQTKEVIECRAEPLGIELIYGDTDSIQLDSSYFGGIVQYPDKFGNVSSHKSFADKCHDNDIKLAVIADILSLVLLESPGSWGADVVVGCTQRFGVPMGYGGPHAAYFACREEYKRFIPGRIIGVSVDSYGNKALRMALQTREQHIKRAKATSNICTAQALLAVMASMYAVYHGPKGLKNIASEIHHKANALKLALSNAGINVLNKSSFDTISFKADLSILEKTLLDEQINIGYYNDEQIAVISVDETTCWEAINKLSRSIGKAFNCEININKENSFDITNARKDEVLSHPVFNSYHSETEMMRYLKKLENKDLSLTHTMISLGSCTMKLNAASEMMPITLPEFANLHPFVPLDQAKGYEEIFNTLTRDLCDITGFDSISLQPNSGAQGEYAGLMVIRAFHKSNNEGHRNICLIPSSAHGTNPASAVMAGMKVIIVNCDENGNIDVEDLKAKAAEHSENLGALMVTYPSTHGVFEESIIDITNIIHEYGGQVYMDGANMNAQVGLTSPGLIGADVCHLNLHKTFAIPHGGGGPGMGPIGVAKHLTPFLPGNPIVKTGGNNAIKSINSAPFGSSLILIISFGYIKMLGSSGLKNSTEIAILNANYLKEKLSSGFDILYTGPNGRVAHEMIIDCRGFKKDSGVEVEDIAKRLIDYGFHAPTVSFPVPGTMMIEPTESEAVIELDRFVEAMLSIREEIKEIEDGIYPKDDNVLKNSPHTAASLLNETWEHSYSRTKAAYPIKNLLENKYWVPVGRVNNAHGDRNLICSCLPIEEYQEEATI